LAAFQAFFSGMPPGTNPGMAFILIQHLDPVRKSLLTDLVRGFTTLGVCEATEGMAVEIDRVYIIPPSKELTLTGGVLHLATQPTPRSLQHPIDAFFSSLADDQGTLAVGVILSGTGSDGTLGIQAIHQQGGLVLAQGGSAVEFPGMPEKAIATGQVDLIVPADKMLGEIQARTGTSWNETLLPEIFSLLQAKTRQDFSKYKPSTIRRRIERRIGVTQTGTMADYLSRLKNDPEEVSALFNDLLIGVTNFFRDPEVFQILATTAIPHILSRQSQGIRAWSAGCSTGEEAYSLAILLQEEIAAQGLERTVNVFASDIDKRAIDAARSARYPASIARDISTERLARFFAPSQDNASYQVKKTIRDLVVFSIHDLIKDPPFFKLDLLVCRNLLIYLNLDLQKKILPMFHYALNPGGILVLGTSETIGEFGHLFQPMDQSGKVFVRRETQSNYPRAGSAISNYYSAPEPSLAKQQDAEVPAVSFRTLTEQSILRVQDMAAALVNAQGEILFLHGRTGYFLEPSEGEPHTQNILKMVKDGLKYSIANALHQAVAGNTTVLHRNVALTWRNQTTLVHIGVHPVEKLFLVLLEEAPAGSNERTAQEEGALAPGDRYLLLKEELETKDKYLQNVTEEMENSNEELRSSNEELQSVNEELQSSNEELETSKEELQSVNEELSTVNAELNSKVAELTTSNNDMNNLLASTGFATVFVDLKQTILRFTPEATRVINLIPGDLGRPVGHLASTLVDYHSLEHDTQAVLDTLIPFEREVQSTKEAWYRLRIQPYRTIDNVIEGAVISFIDITQIVTQRKELQSKNALLRLVAVIQDSRDPIIVQDLNGQILAWNPAATEHYGWSEKEALTMNARDFIPQSLQAEALDKIRQLGLSDVLETYQTKRLTKDGRVLDAWVTSTALVDKEKNIYAITTIERTKRAIMKT